MNGEIKPSLEYEIFTKELFEKLLKLDGFQDAAVHHNGFIKGKSGATHQIDVYWTLKIAGTEQLFCIECKKLNRPVEKSNILQFKGVLDDISAKGIYISKEGYQSGAKIYANHFNIELLTAAYFRKYASASLELLTNALMNITVKTDAPVDAEIPHGTKVPDLSVFDANGKYLCNMANIFQSISHYEDGHYSTIIGDKFLKDGDDFYRIECISYDYKAIRNPKLRLSTVYQYVEAVTKYVSGGSHTTTILGGGGN